MAVLILVALLIPPFLAGLGVIAWQLALFAEIAILLGAAWNFDRARRPGAPGPVWDSSKPEFPPPMIAGVRGIPTEAVEAPPDQTRPTRPGGPV
jgi:hypothetical protein